MCWVKSLCCIMFDICKEKSCDWGELETLFVSGSYKLHAVGSHTGSFPLFCGLHVWGYALTRRFSTMSEWFASSISEITYVLINPMLQGKSLFGYHICKASTKLTLSQVQVEEPDEVCLCSTWLGGKLHNILHQLGIDSSFLVCRWEKKLSYGFGRFALLHC